MDGLAGSFPLAPWPLHTCVPILAGDFYLHHPTHSSLQPILDQPDGYDELHDSVSRRSL